MGRTLVLDLLGVTLSVLKRELRKNIKKGDAQLTMQKWEYGDYFSKLVEFRKLRGLVTKPVLITEVEYYVAVYNGIPACGQGVYFRDGKAIEIAIWSSENAPYYAGDWLKWRIILNAKLRDHRQYDFAGVSDYKHKWGGTIVDDGLPEPAPHPLKALRPIHRWLVKKGIVG